MCRQHGFAPARVRPARDPEFLFGLLLAGGAVAGAPDEQGGPALLAPAARPWPVRFGAGRDEKLAR
ncbi:hypothetical protein [Micromonospora sp. CNB394]|uniref:hypothetical protein n=1 Tax=Micromonospora sp. CNB394 TaxID=1169151 RepID=UPI000361503E|nr:hypothetical protein [Micromonospora sp. CNB394]